MHFFGCYQGKPILQIKPHLVAKTTLCTRAGTVRFKTPFIQDVLKKVKVLLHRCKLLGIRELTFEILSHSRNQELQLSCNGNGLECIFDTSPKK
jgi:hypothetical protein